MRRGYDRTLSKREKEGTQVDSDAGWPYLEALRRGLGVGDVAVGVVLEGRLAVAGEQWSEWGGAKRRGAVRRGAVRRGAKRRTVSEREKDGDRVGAVANGGLRMSGRRRQWRGGIKWTPVCGYVCGVWG